MGRFCALLLAAFGFFTLLHRPASAVFSTSDCGTTKSCMRHPANCDPSAADCVFFSWIWNGNFFEMELSGGAGASDTYAGVAFGQVDGMLDADLYYCTGPALLSGVITTQSRPTSLDIDTENAVNQTSAATTNGVAECTFRRAASVTKSIRSGPKDFDLSSGTYYILLAQGAITGGQLQYHTATGREISSSLIDMTASPSSPTTATTGAPQTTATLGPRDTACGTTKGCFTYPSNCAETSPDCIYFTWAYDSASSTFNMELSGGTGGGATYAAVAFGQVNGMQDADLYYCTGNTLESGVITQNEAPPTRLDIAAENGITSPSASTANGVAKCTFTRAASITKTISSGSKNFDLSADTYYILLARGSASSGVVSYHGNSQRAISSTRMDLKTNTGGAAQGADILVKTHGALMITAWLVLVNLGVAVARHLKPLYPDTKPGGQKLWFQLHRTIMVTVLLLTSTAFIIIFVHVGGYSANIPAHAIIGIIVMALTILNPVIAIFRPHPNTPNRYIFNWTHYLIGISARGLGTANLFLGVNAIGVLSSWGIPVLGGFVGWIFVGEIVLEVVSYQYGHAGNRCAKPKADPPAQDSDLQMEEPPVRVRGQGVKTTMFLIYAIGLLGFAIAFYVDLSYA